MWFSVLSIMAEIAPNHVKTFSITECLIPFQIQLIPLHLIYTPQSISKGLEIQGRRFPHSKLPVLFPGALVCIIKTWFVSLSIP